MRDEETQQLFIPEKMKVGFQNRDGTYNGKLAYIIYFYKKGVLRKEKLLHARLRWAVLYEKLSNFRVYFQKAKMEEKLLNF